MVTNATDRIAAAVEALRDAVDAYPIALGEYRASSSAWDNDGGAVELPVTMQFIHVYCEGDMWLIATDAAATYTGTLPAVYAGGATHVIGTRGMTWLHYKNAESDDLQDISITGYRIF